MILPLALLLAASSGSGPADANGPGQARFDACVKEADSDPAGAEQVAKQWAATGGGVMAAQCIGIARSNAGNFAGAYAAFASAASLAEQTHQPVTAANMWASAGNAALAGGDAAKAREALGRSIDTPELPDAMKGEAHIDRARAGVAAGDNEAARADLDAALKLVPGDPMGWLLSATLARRMGDLTRAQTDIGQATMRAPNQSDILYEAGNIAAAGGHIGDARAQWTRAASAEPESPAAARARAELAATGAPLPAPKPKSEPRGR